MRPAERDTLVIHYSHGSSAFDAVFGLPGRKMILYHRITPTASLRGISAAQAEASDAAARDLHRFAPRVFASVAHSRRRRGGTHRRWICKSQGHSLPALRAAVSGRAEFSRSATKTIAVVGRVVPHKRIEHAIHILRALVRCHGSDWRLVVAGDPVGAESYLERLAIFAYDAGVADHVMFTGRISQAELISLYQSAAALVFPSGHEGFGVPLVEAMRFDLPVFARRTQAVAETMGDAGVLFAEEPPDMLASQIARVLSDPAFRETILSRQRERAGQLSPESVSRQWAQWQDLA